MYFKRMLNDYLALAKEEGHADFAVEGFQQLYDEAHKALNQLEAEKAGAFAMGVVVGGLVLGTVGIGVGIVISDK